MREFGLNCGFCDGGGGGQCHQWIYDLRGQVPFVIGKEMEEGVLKEEILVPS